VNLILSVTGSEKSIKNLTELLYTVKIWQAVLWQAGKGERATIWWVSEYSLLCVIKLSPQKEKDMHVTL
jgi:hypothetical protein